MTIEIKTFFLITIIFLSFLLDYLKDLYSRFKAVFKALKEGDDNGQRST